MYQIKRPSTLDEILMLEGKKLRTTPNEKKNETTRFEYLSNELFYEIFEYLHGIDIYQAFFNLNSRFQHLLTYSSISLKIKLISELETELVVHHCNNVIKPNKHRILSLSLQNNLLINKFFTFCPIDSSFDRLESVVLNGILSETSMLAIFHLKSLPRLFSLTMNFRTVGDGYLDDIYQIIFSFSSLKYNKLSILSDFAIESMNPFASVLFNQQCSTIEYLIINHSCTIDELLSILRYVPHLRHLSCQNLGESLIDINSIQPIMLPSLTYISIINPLIMFFEFEMLIMKLSTMIQVLKIDLFDDITYMNTHRWEQLIIKHMPQLCKFYLTYLESEIDLEDVSLSGLVNQFTSSFWIERQWFLECVIDCTGTHYSVRPYRNIYLDIYKHTEIATYFNHNVQHNSTSKIIQLRIDEISDNETHQAFLDRFKTTFVDVSFTRLIINCRNIPMGILVKIIYLLPNLDSLQVSSLPLIQPNWLFDDNNKDIRFITSFRNKITKVNLGKIIDIEQIHFILHLCPSIQYLQIDIPANIDLDKLIRFILIKSLTYIPHLCSLCLTIPNADNKVIDQLQKLIKSEKLLINYKIKRICDDILLKWK